MTKIKHKTFIETNLQDLSHVSKVKDNCNTNYGIENNELNISIVEICNKHSFSQVSNYE